MERDPLFKPPVPCHSPQYGRNLDEYPNNQSRTSEEQMIIIRNFWPILRHYQQFVKMPVYDPPGLGNCGYYAIAHAVGYTDRDAHQRVRDELLKELLAHKQDYMKIHSHGAKKGKNRESRKQILITAAETQLDYFEKRLVHQGLKAPRSKWFDTLMGFIVASTYRRPFVVLGEDTSGCYLYLPYRHRPNTKSPIIIGFQKSIHFLQFTPNEGKFGCFCFVCSNC